MPLLVRHSVCSCRSAGAFSSSSASPQRRASSVHRMGPLVLNLNPPIIAVAATWLVLALLTTIGSRARGETILRAVAWGFAFPATWVVWLIQDNHAAGRKAFRSR